MTVERFGPDLMLAEKLAAGGMAEVYRAIQFGHGGFEKIIALKRILPHYAADDEFKHMFQMEANLSGQLQHPNIVQIFTNGESEGYLYLLMEFVDGKNVRQLLARADKKRIKIPIQFSCYMVAEACKGLEYAHNFNDPKTGERLNIVHRDMSPQNIMLSYDGAVKIVDFGIAKAAARSENTRAGILKGKFGYMSPEQAQGMPLDHRTDVFAMGIILFELLTQRRLFSHDDDMRTLQLVRDCNVPRPSKYNPDVGPTLDRIVLKALTKNKADRYATSGEFYADLIRFMNSRYPEFIPTDFSKFLKKIFESDMAEEKKKREKIAAEMPARLGSTSSASGKNEKGVKIRDEDSTNLEEMGKGTDLTSNDMEGLEALGGGALSLKGAGITQPGDTASLPPAQDSGPLPGPADKASGGSSHLSLTLPTGKSQASSLVFKSHNSLQVAKSNTLPTPKPEEKKAPDRTTGTGTGARPVIDPTKKTASAVSVTLTPPPSTYRAGGTGGSYRPSPSINGTPASRAVRKDSSSFAGSFLMLILAVVFGGGGFYMFKDNIFPPSEGRGPASPVDTTSNTNPKSHQTKQPEFTPPPVERERPLYTPPDNSGIVKFNSDIPLTVKEIVVDGQTLADKNGHKINGTVKTVDVGPGTHMIEIVGSPFNKHWRGSVSVKAGIISPVDVELH